MQLVRWLPVVLIACGGSKPASPPANRTTTVEAAPPTRSKDPYQAATWIAKLGDPRERERAITELEQLGDPAAIEPLGKLWIEDRSVRSLQVLISLARPLTPDEAKARFFTDYEATGRPASWQRAQPFLIRALTDLDPANPRSVDAATKAADALGEARLPDAIEPLLAVARRTPDKKTFQAQISAVRALGRQIEFKASVGPALGKLIDVDPPRHPRAAKSKEEARPLEERFGMHLAISGASINALGALQATTETTALILALYRTPELTSQIRRTLVGIGAPARDALLDVIAGKHAAVEKLFTANKLGRYCGDKDELPDAQCMRVSMRDFYAALLLGDFHDPRAVPALLDALQRPAAPAYYADDTPGPTQHRAIFDALRKVGTPEAAAPLRAMWMDRKLDIASKAAAIETYAFVARDATGRAELAKIAADNSANDELRQAAASTVARISTDKADISLFLKLADKYLDASAKKRKEADAKQAAAEAAERPLAAMKQQHEASKAALELTAKDPNSTTDAIKQATASARRISDAYQIAKRTHKEATRPFRDADMAAKAYLGFARMFQTHVARIEVAIRCKADVDCYASSLQLQPAQAATQVSTYLKDISTWSSDEKLGLVEATIERSMLELGKRGSAASKHTDALLDAARSDNRVIRQSILLALPKIAKVPCTECVAKLEAAMAAGEGKVSLGDLNTETAIVRAYFLRAGGRVP
ncbi:MAG: hypothetical protein H0V17_10770 [Deltaproteobacteria bacterium]|nr:hypothetical protein [Deltaproteobacteria bacterium]